MYHNRYGFVTTRNILAEMIVIYTTQVLFIALPFLLCKAGFFAD
jgi:hypothetical protein